MFGQRSRIRASTSGARTCSPSCDGHDFDRRTSGIRRRGNHDHASLRRPRAAAGHAAELRGRREYQQGMVGSTPALKQDCPECAFQRGQRFRHRRLRETERPRRHGHAALFNERDERARLPDLQAGRWCARLCEPTTGLVAHRVVSAPARQPWPHRAPLNRASDLGCRRDGCIPEKSSLDTTYCPHGALRLV